MSHKIIKGEDNCPVKPKTLIESTTSTREDLKVENAATSTHDLKEQIFKKVKFNDNLHIKQYYKKTKFDDR